MNVTKADAGTYTCTAENQFGKANGTTHLVVTGACFSQFALLQRKVYFIREKWKHLSMQRQHQVDQACLNSVQESKGENGWRGIEVD